MKNMRYRTKYFFLYMESYITQKCILYCKYHLWIVWKRWVNFCLTRVESGEEKIGKLVHLVLIINQMLYKGFLVSQNGNNLLTYNIFSKLQDIFNFRGQKSRLLMKNFFLLQTLKVDSTIAENTSKRRDSCHCVCVCGLWGDPILIYIFRNPFSFHSVTIKHPRHPVKLTNNVRYK